MWASQVIFFLLFPSHSMASSHRRCTREQPLLQARGGAAATAATQECGRAVTAATAAASATQTSNIRCRKWKKMGNEEEDDMWVHTSVIGR